MANIETNVTNAYESTLTAQLSSVGTSMQLADVTGLTVPFYLVIEPTNAGQREYVYVTTLVSNMATIAARYLAGSAAGSGLTHPNGSVVRMSIMSQHLIDINDRVDDVQSQVNSLSDHGSLAGLADDDHTQYFNTVRHTKSVHDLLALDHGALSGKSDDDHTIYYNAARHTKAVHDALALDHGALSGRGDDDHTIYTKADGTRAFTGTVAGVTPTSGSHLATKTYVDNAGVTDHGALSGLGDDDHSQYHNDARAATWAAGWHDARDHSAVAATIHPHELASGLHASGSGASPGISFLADSNSGFYVVGNDGVIHWSGNGANGGRLKGNGIVTVTGSVGAPPYTFSGDEDTGMYRFAAGSVGFAGNGVVGLIASSTGIQVDDGSAATPGIRFVSDGDAGFYYISNNVWGWAGGGQENLRMQNIANGTTSVLSLRDGLTDVGNVETLRLNRGSGTTIQAVGYFSSWEFDPISGERMKEDIVSLIDSPRFPGVSIIDSIEPVDFRRVSTGQREWGYLLDAFRDVTDDLRYLTTKGDEWGHSPDDIALSALQMLAIKDLRSRVAALEAA
jgi:hypothetical protein